MAAARAQCVTSTHNHRDAASEVLTQLESGHLTSGVASCTAASHHHPFVRLLSSEKLDTRRRLDTEFAKIKQTLEDSLGGTVPFTNVWRK